MSGGFLAVQAKRTKDRNKKINLGRDSILQGWTNQAMIMFHANILRSNLSTPCIES